MTSAWYNKHKMFISSDADKNEREWDTFDKIGDNENHIFHCVSTDDSDDMEPVKKKGYKKPYRMTEGTYEDQINCTGQDFDSDYIWIHEKDPTQVHWNPLFDKYQQISDKTNVPEEIMEDLEKCCANDYTLETDTVMAEKCGNINPENPLCQTAMFDYCNNDSNVTDNKCKNLLKEENFSDKKKALLLDKLKNKCKGTTISNDIKDACSCYRDNSYYENIAQNIEKVWKGPPGFLDRTPQCIDPKCLSSSWNFQGKRDCKEVSFSQCIQNTNLNLQDSKVIGDIKMDSKCDMGNTFTKITEPPEPNITEPPEPESDSDEEDEESEESSDEEEPSDEPESDSDKEEVDEPESDSDEEDSGMSTTVIVIIVVVVLIILAVVLYFMFGSKDKQERTRRVAGNMRAGAGRVAGNMRARA